MTVTQEKLAAVLEQVDQGLARCAELGMVGLAQVKTLVETQYRLVAFREHPDYAAIICNIESDMLDGLDNACPFGPDDEQVEAESAQRKAGYALLYELLAGKPYAPPVYTDDENEPERPVLRLVK